MEKGKLVPETDHIQSIHEIPANNLAHYVEVKGVQNVKKEYVPRVKVRERKNETLTERSVRPEEISDRYPFATDRQHQ